MSEKTKILVIDDEETMCNLLKDTLSEQGYKVTATQKAKNGLKIAQKESFDLIITDLKMPELDGIEIIRQIKKFDADNMVLVITAYPSLVTVQEALRLGVYSYITKPFNLEEILFIVKRAIEFRRLRLSNKNLLKRLEKENITLEKKVKEKTRDLRALYRDMQYAYTATIKALAQALDAKSHYTHSHSEKVTKYAVAIAIKMDFSPQKVEVLKEACQLHDLGKIGLHDHILNKPGKLTEKEWADVKSHSLRAVEILGPLTFLDEVKILIRQHHERYDGKGYPKKLKGKKIKLGARIIAVADAFDAMISKRPYRKAYSKGEAVSKLKKNSGTQFDPQVVNALLEILKEKPEII